MVHPLPLPEGIEQLDPRLLVGSANEPDTTLLSQPAVRAVRMYLDHNRLQWLRGEPVPVLGFDFFLAGDVSTQVTQVNESKTIFQCDGKQGRQGLEVVHFSASKELDCIGRTGQAPSKKAPFFTCPSSLSPRSRRNFSAFLSHSNMRLGPVSVTVYGAI